MDRLSGLDASFLYLETPAQLMHVCGRDRARPVDHARAAYSFDALHDRHRRRASATSRSSRASCAGSRSDLDHPVWVQRQAVRHRAARAPARAAEAGRLQGADRARRPPRRPAARPLPPAVGDVGHRGLRRRARSRAGRGLLEDAPRDRRRRLRRQPDLAPVQPRAGRASRWRPARDEGVRPHEPGRRELLGRGRASRTFTRPFDAARAWSRRPCKGITKTVGRAREGTAMAAPLTAPRTSFNGTITGHRAIASRRHEPRRHQGGQDGHRHHRQRRGARRGRRRAARLPRGPRRAARQLAAGDRPGHRSARRRSASPAPTRSPRCSPGSAPTSRTRWSGSRTWPTPTGNAKEHHKAISADSLQDWAEFAAPRTFGLAVRAYAGLRLAEKHPVVHNLVISNVPGPPVPLYFMGAEIEALLPARPGLPRRRPQHHRDVQQRPGRTSASSPAASRCRTSTTWPGASRPSWPGSRRRSQARRSRRRSRRQGRAEVLTRR